MTGGAARSPSSLLRSVRNRARRVERSAHRRFLRFPNRVQCPVCGWSGPRLATSRNPRRPNRICPDCRSSERYRALHLLLTQRGPVEPGTRLLEVAPIRSVKPLAEGLGYTYASVDLKSRTAQVLGDLTALPFGDATFDLIVCFHVLEHVPADDEAVRELARVVGREGEVLVVVPSEDDRPTTFEDPDARPEDYERLYGQSDHVRIYGGDIARRWDLPGISLTQDAWADRFAPDVHHRAALTGDDDRFWIIQAAPVDA